MEDRNEAHTRSLLYASAKRILQSMEAYLASLQDNLESVEELFRLLFPSITGKRKIENISSVSSCSEVLSVVDTVQINEKKIDFAAVEWEDGDVEVRLMQYK